MTILQIHDGEITLNGQKIENPGRVMIIIDKGRTEIVLHADIKTLDVDAISDCTIINDQS